MQIGLTWTSWTQIIQNCDFPTYFPPCPMLKTQVVFKGMAKSRFLPPANEVLGKIICLQVCVYPQGGGGACSGGSGPGGCLLRGVPALGGLVWGYLVWGVPGGDTPQRLLLRAVRIVLECILVWNICYSKIWKHKKDWFEILEFILVKYMT